MAQERVAEFVELTSPEARLPQVCARAALHHEAGRTVALYVPDPAEAAELDKALWTFRQNSFIPHVRLAEAEEPIIEPVILFGDRPPAFDMDALVVVSPDALPEGFERFMHVCDFAEVYDEARREAARKRFAALKAAGYRMRFIGG